MEEKKICKFDIVSFLAVLILIAFIGCMCVAVVFGIKNYKISNNVAYAYSFNPNLLAHTDYNVQFTIDGSSNVLGVPYAENVFLKSSANNLSVVGSSSGVVLSRASGFSLFGGFAALYTMDVSKTYTLTIHILDFTGDNVRLLFGNYYNNNLGFTAEMIVSQSGDVSLTGSGKFGSTSSHCNCIAIDAGAGCSITFDKIKLEEGDSFTGWEDITLNPYYQQGYASGYDVGHVDGYQAGYNSGFDAGLNSFSGRTNYQLIGNLGRINYSDLQDNPLLDLDFVFQNQHYTFLDSQNTSVQFEERNTYSFYYPDGNWSLDYLPGVKVVSNLLYGNILITCPYWIGSMFWQIVFEDTITGAVVYTDYRDSLHYKFVPSYTFQENSQSTTSGYPSLDSWNFFDIEYFFENPQNIYFIPSRDNHLWNLSDGDIVLYPTNEFFNIYSTQSQTALTSFDDGYQKGVEAGREGAVSENAQAVSNARAAGYEEGRRDALADGNDYTFMGLLGAVFDAPIKSFQGLLNFDVLGVNMKSFVLALLSLSVIIIIIKIALGGK